MVKNIPRQFARYILYSPEQKIFKFMILFLYLWVRGIEKVVIRDFIRIKIIRLHSKHYIFLLCLL